ncbi:MAG TPA: RNA-binding cell elongation regulator Jag/EloR [Dehalococcoidia bacterium]|nr:RNA-binding cell elongation regulator Jag/EloR [Dehalococcoidia bacterium]
MAGVEASGKTVEEAIERALRDLGVTREQVEIEVLSEGRAGIFGFGGEPARVRVTPRASAGGPGGEDTETALEVLRELLRLMGIEATVSARAPETPGDGVGMAKAVLDVNGEDLGILIGRRGETLAALQYTVNLIVGRKFDGQSVFSVDVEGYRRRREQTLRRLALRMAERVKETGRPVTLEPMPANERRIVHLALAQDPKVVTASLGEGENRKVSISLKR